MLAKIKLELERVSDPNQPPIFADGAGYVHEAIDISGGDAGWGDPEWIITVHPEKFLIILQSLPDKSGEDCITVAAVAAGVEGFQ